MFSVQVYDQGEFKHSDQVSARWLRSVIWHFESKGYEVRYEKVS